MKVNTNQPSSVADAVMEKVESDLDTINELVEWSGISKRLRQVKSDYSPLSLFKVLILQTWHQLSDAGMSQALRRDLAYMKFAGFTLEGNKPERATICRFRNRLVDMKLWGELLTVMNESLEERGCKVAGGRYVSTDATLIHSARRPRKRYEARKEGEGRYEMETEPVYSDDKQARYVVKGGKLVYGYATATMSTDEQGLVESVQSAPADGSEMKGFKA